MTKCNAKFASCLGKASCPRNLMKAFPQDDRAVLSTESMDNFPRVKLHGFSTGRIETDEMGLDQAVSSYII